jgi:hypothetical protein
MPTEGTKYLQFENYKNQLKAPWVMYADFEANTTKIEGPARNPAESFTQKTNLHEACGFALRAVRSDGASIRPIVYRGPDCVKRFLEEVKKFDTDIRGMLENRIKDINLTNEEKEEHCKTKSCCICKERGFENGNKKVCIMQKAICYDCARKV